MTCHVQRDKHIGSGVEVTDPKGSDRSQIRPAHHLCGDSPTVVFVVHNTVGQPDLAVT